VFGLTRRRAGAPVLLPWRALVTHVGALGDGPAEGGCLQTSAGNRDHGGWWGQAVVVCSGTIHG